MHLVTWNVHTVTGSNSPIHSNHRTSRIPRYCCPNHRRSPSMFHSWNQEFSIIGFCGRSAWCWVQRDGQLTWPCYVSNHQPSRFYHRHTVFFTFYCCWICEALVRLFVLKQRLQGEYWVLLSTLLRQFSDLQTQSCSMYRDPFHLFWFSATAPLSWRCVPTICVSSQPCELLLWIQLMKWPFGHRRYS